MLGGGAGGSRERPEDRDRTEELDPFNLLVSVTQAKVFHPGSSIVFQPPTFYAASSVLPLSEALATAANASLDLSLNSSRLFPLLKVLVLSSTPSSEV